MSIRWIRNVNIDGEKAKIEVQLGERKFGDKCYTRIGDETEKWFDNLYDNRDDILAQGIDILKQRLEDKEVTYPDGTAFDWQ